MNAQTKIQLSYETIAEAMQREGISQIKDNRPVGVQNAYTVTLHNGNVGLGPTLRDAIDAAKTSPLKVAA